MNKLSCLALYTLLVLGVISVPTLCGAQKDRPSSPDSDKEKILPGDEVALTPKEEDDWSFGGGGAPAGDYDFECDQDLMAGSNASDTAILSGETYKGDGEDDPIEDDLQEDWGFSGGISGGGISVGGGVSGFEGDGNTTTSSSTSISQTATAIVLFTAMLPLARI